MAVEKMIFKRILIFFVVFFAWKVAHVVAVPCGGDINASNVTYNPNCVTTCDNYKSNIQCNIRASAQGCSCNKGYIFDGVSGKCVLPANCPAGCGGDVNGQFLGCGDVCPRTCARPNVTICPDICRLGGGCGCKDGFVHGPDGKCILPSQCDVCGPNEHLEKCPYSCPPEDCSAIGVNFFCPRQPPPNCKPSCRCNLNYKRDNNKVCVPIEECPPLTCTGQNEVYNSCPLNCPAGDGCDVASLNGVCPFRLGIRLICRPACTCAKGYYRNSNTSLCIPQKDCFSCTKDNEEFRQSGPAIQPTCSSLYADNTGIFANQQRSGCYCKQGFIRDSNNNCIDVKSCYQDLCGKNEVRSCGSACDTTCATLNVTCPIINVRCNNMCYCQKGFARDDCGLCIPIKQCPAKVGCNGDANALNVSCPNPCPQSCESALSGVKNPVCTRLCVREGCQCKKGFVKDETTDNNCVQIKNCHKCTGPNEQWSRNVDCTCDNIENCQSKKPDGSEGCRCIDGYVRDVNGICIQAGTCPRCGPLEDYNECGTACSLTCRHPFQNEFCIDRCVKGCFCKPGLVRDINGKCVQRDQCSTIGCNGDYDASNVTCPSPCPNTCTNYKQTNRICPRFCLQFGCQCNEGFVLDETTNQCVLPPNCPGCGGDPNAVDGTYTAGCISTCENPTAGERPCILQNIVKGCVCNAGYLHDSQSNSCVLSSQCPPIVKKP